VTEARLREAFLHQSGSCADLGSPFMAQLCRVLAHRLAPGTALADRLFGWPGDLSPRAESVPLRLCGALHALRLSGDPGLAACYPPAKVDDDTLWQAVSDAMGRHAGAIDRFIDSPPQTNEVRRAAVLIAVANWLTAEFGKPLVLSELGASAGLNLMFDRFALAAGDRTFGPAGAALTLRPDWRGDLPPMAAPTVATRRGVDLNPLSPRTDALRLTAYLWPDQPERLALTRAAIAAFDATVDRADAIDWLAPRLVPAPGHLHLVYSTIAWQYFPAERQAKGRAMIEAAGAQATDVAPLAWFGMEADDKTPGAALTLRLWPGDRTLDLGRVDFHGRWVDWRSPT
jgi:hypothetical protein